METVVETVLFLFSLPTRDLCLLFDSTLLVFSYTELCTE